MSPLLPPHSTPNLQCPHHQHPALLEEEHHHYHQDGRDPRLSLPPLLLGMTTTLRDCPRGSPLSTVLPLLLPIGLDPYHHLQMRGLHLWDATNPQYAQGLFPLFLHPAVVRAVSDRQQRPLQWDVQGQSRSAVCMVGDHLFLQTGLEQEHLYHHHQWAMAFKTLITTICRKTYPSKLAKGEAKGQ
uniref:Uncharacterized protein n=1 Tax=Knipowitschia caucasica TaxID=637954 RepID=A0AAV2JKF2_KNICA